MVSKSINVNAQNIIDNLPGLIWIKDINFQYIMCNERCRQFVGFPSKNYLIGRDDYNSPWEDYADIYREGDIQVLESGKSLSFLHPIRLYEGRDIAIITRKSPFYDDSNHIVGITGFISVITAPNTIHKLISLSNYDHDLISISHQNKLQYVLSDNFEKFNLSKRETTCLFYLLRGKTAKEIAEIIFISVRTVEKHIDSIRMKLHCKTRSEIIGKAIDQGFVHFVPSDYLIEQM